MNATDRGSTTKRARRGTAAAAVAAEPAAPAKAGGADAPTAGVNATREPSFLLAKPEKRVLRAIARRLPRWILPDDLTLLGIVAAAAICIAYLLSNGSDAWLWVASGLLVVHWLGDSLDGTLARVRGIQRPRYGYYLDHLADAISTGLVGLGLGLTAHMHLTVALLRMGKRVATYKTSETSMEELVGAMTGAVGGASA